MMTTDVTEVTESPTVTLAVCGTPGGTLRERQRVETRSLIIDAALELFEARGYEQTTVEDISNAAGISARTFFRYFESKNSVLFDDGRNKDDHDDVIDAIVARPATESMTEALRAVLHDKLARMFADDNGRKLRQLRVVLHEPSLQVLARDSFHEHGPELARAFAARLGTTPEELAPRVFAAAFTEAIWIILERWSASGAEVSHLPQLIDEAFAALHNGLG
jgi:AcrR family transcriptional regulator